ncbi:MAG: rRNA cytosine-C5-methyltransferase [Firmicutes bacterium]|nr:rRNA cytosine-C5-methyltransferase [Bacillota bacterium]MCM1401504.1 rRNA cytosine-C5-methyltransferase [Bacteroides sp.]
MPAPEALFELLERSGAPWTEALRTALAQPPTVAIRLNRRKGVGFSPVGGMPVPWCETGFRLPERPAFTFDPSLHQGRYYVQDPSSMFVEHVVKHLTAGCSGPLTVLDACAAPGGKTTALIDALPPGSLVVANEFVPKRAAVLRENLAKWGYPLIVVTQGDTARFAEMPGSFDIVLADVPCSGEGMMRKEPEAVAQWSEELIDQCVARQREIVDNLWDSLRPGGYMIYSTCTFNAREDEQMLEYLASKHGAEPVAIPIPENSGIVPEICGSMPACRFVPGLVEGEGLFMAVVRKSSQSGQTPSPKANGYKPKEKRQRAEKKAAVPKGVEQWLTDAYPFELKLEGDTVKAFFNAPEPFAPTLEVATVKGRDVIPTQQLALSLALNREAFGRVEVSAEQAIDYLRCEAIVLPPQAPRGIVLLTYGGLPLGFVKNLGNRANNLYPKSWRILSQRPSTLTLVGSQM